MRRIVLLTGQELRHEYFCKFMALQSEFSIVGCYCEGTETSLQKRIEAASAPDRDSKAHVLARAASEKDYFADFCATHPMPCGTHAITKGAINDSEQVEAIKALNPDLLLCYGSSLIKPPLIEAFPQRFLNVHLGLSPYYRGAGTNIWTLINNEPEYFGATFMYLDAGIDTGEIIHQIRASLKPGDTPHSIGNRLIQDMVACYAELVKHFDALCAQPQPSPQATDKLIRRKDFTPEVVKTLYQNFESGLITRYLEEQQRREEKVPLVHQPCLT